MNRPAFITDEHIQFLNSLYDKEVRTMLNVAEAVQKKFPRLTKLDIAALLAYWIKNS